MYYITIHVHVIIILLPVFSLIIIIELSFLETSALTGENVEEVFSKCTRSILTKIDAGMTYYHLNSELWKTRYMVSL